MDWSRPISAENRPPGTDIVELPGCSTIIGRVVANDRRCPWHPEDHMMIVRSPTTRLHLPGTQAPVNELSWCPTYHVVGQFADDAHTPEEIEWGWNHTTVT